MLAMREHIEWADAGFKVLAASPEFVVSGLRDKSEDETPGGNTVRIPLDHREHYTIRTMVPTIQQAF